MPPSLPHPLAPFNQDVHTALHAQVEAARRAHEREVMAAQAKRSRRQALVSAMRQLQQQQDGRRRAASVPGAADGGTAA